MKNVLITGGLGHIGSCLMRNLSDKYNIKIIDNFLTQRYCSLFNLNSKIRFIEKDIKNITIKDLNNVDIVIHLAAITDAVNSFNSQIEIEEVNIKSTKRFINICKKSKIKLFIFPSTTSVYGISTDNAYEDDEKFLNPQSPYAESKLKIENYIKKKLGKDIKYLILRLGTIFGVSNGMRFHTAINKFCYQISLNQSLTIWKQNINQYRSYLGLNDFTKCLEHLIDNNLLWNNTFNVLTNNYKLNNIIDSINKISEKKIKINMVNSPLLNQCFYKVSNEKIIKTGFNFEDNIEDSIKKTINLLSGLI